MQPGALNATTGPRAPLEWGQLNIIHTTDTHGWLEGHLKEQNYGADWGDFSSFVTHMQHMAGNLAVDLLVIGQCSCYQVSDKQLTEDGCRHGRSARWQR